MNLGQLVHKSALFKIYFSVDPIDVIPLQENVIEQKLVVIKEEVKIPFESPIAHEIETTNTNNVKAEYKGDWQCYVCGNLRPEKSEITKHIR